MSRLLQLLQIWPNEIGKLGKFSLLNFLIMSGLFLAKATRDSLFFRYAGADMLPFMFVINAVSLTALSIWLSRVEARFQVKWLLVVAVATTMVLGSAFGVAFGLFELESLHVAWFFVLFVLCEAAVFLLIVLYWSFTGAFFLPKHSERLFPKFVGSGHLGTTTGGLLALLLAPTLGTSAMLLVWGGLLFCGLVVIAWICNSVKTIESEDDPLPMAEGPAEDEDVGFLVGFQTIFKSRYLKLFTFVTVCAFFLGSVYDFALADTAAEFFGDDLDRQTAWLGGITIGFGVAAFFIQFFVITRLIRWLSVEKVNLFAPGLLAVGAIGLSWYSFAAAAMARFLYLTNEFVFNQTLIQFIYAVVPDDQREKARYTIEGGVTNLSIGLAGLFLLIPAYMTDMPRAFLVNIALLLGIAMFVLSIFLGREYRDNILEGGEKRGAGHAARLRRAVVFDSANSLKVIQQSLDSSEESLVLTAVDIVRDAGECGKFVNELVRLASKGDAPRVQQASIRALSDVITLEELRNLREQTTGRLGGYEPETIHALGSLYIQLGCTKELAEELGGLLEVGSARVRAAVLRLLVESGDIDAWEPVSHALGAMMGEGASAAMRAEAIKVLGELRSTSQLAKIEAGLGEGQPLLVRREAIRALGLVRHVDDAASRKALATLLRLSEDGDLLSAAEESIRLLLAQSPSLVGDLLSRDPEPRHLPMMLTLCPTEEVDSFLLSRLSHDDSDRAQAAFRALDTRHCQDLCHVALQRNKALEQYKDRVLRRVYAFQVCSRRLDLGQDGPWHLRWIASEARYRFRRSLRDFLALVRMQCDSSIPGLEPADLVEQLQSDHAMERDQAINLLERLIPDRQLYNELQELCDAADVDNAGGDRDFEQGARKLGSHPGDKVEQQLAYLEREGDEWLAQIIARTIRERTSDQDDPHMARTELFLRCNLFRNMPGEALHELTRGLKRETFEAPEVILRSNEESEALFVIEEGRVELSRRGDHLLTRETGSTVGEFELLQAEAPKRDYEASALSERVTGYWLRREDLLALLSRDRESAGALLENLIGRLRLLNEWASTANTEESEKLSQFQGHLIDTARKLDSASERLEIQRKSTEVEFKWLVDCDEQAISKLDGVQKLDLEQYYIISEDAKELRLRRANNLTTGMEKCFLTIKGGTGVARGEIETLVPRRMFDECRVLRLKSIIHKTRYKIPHQGVVWEVDVYAKDSPLHGLVVAEVELPDEQTKVSDPPLIKKLKEVTEDSRYKNKNLALNGRIPK